MPPMKEQAYPGPFLTIPPPASPGAAHQPLPLHSTGSPTPTIHWSKLRSPLPWQHQLEGDTLIIPRVAQQDSGQYICNATNPAGHAEATIALHVESKALIHPPRATLSALHGGLSPATRPHPGQSSRNPIWRVACTSGPGACPNLKPTSPPATLASPIPSPLGSPFSFPGPLASRQGPAPAPILTSALRRPDLCVSNPRPAVCHHSPGARLGAGRGDGAAPVPGSWDAPTHLPVEPCGRQPPWEGDHQE